MSEGLMLMSLHPKWGWQATCDLMMVIRLIARMFAR